MASPTNRAILWRMRAIAGVLACSLVAQTGFSTLAWAQPTEPANEAGDSWVEAEPPEVPTDESGAEPAPVPPTHPQSPSTPASVPPMQLRPPPHYVPVTFEHSTPRLRLSLAVGKRERPFVVCPAPCTVMVPPGEYWVSVNETTESLAGTRRIRVDGPSLASVEPRARADRETGLTLGILGIVMIFGGMGAMLASVPNDRSGEVDTAWMLTGITGVIGGLIMTPIGWVQFGRRNPSVEVTPSPSSW